MFVLESNEKLSEKRQRRPMRKQENAVLKRSQKVGRSLNDQKVNQRPADPEDWSSAVDAVDSPEYVHLALDSL